MAFVERRLEVTFQKGTGVFDESGTDTVTLSGLRVSARITKAGTPGLSHLSMRIWGMTLSLMNQLSTLGMLIPVQEVQRNVVTLRAGDDGGNLGTAFIGTILSAYSDFQPAPDVPFVLESQTGAIQNASGAPATSVQGSGKAQDIMAGLAKQMSVGFENNGVDVTLDNPYFSGSAWQQAQACAEAGQFEWNLVDDTGKLTMALWPRGGARNGVIPLIEPPNLVGYPAYTQQGIQVKTLYLPTIGFGSQIEVRSSLKPATGVWSVYSLDHELDALLPNGKWFTTIGGYQPGSPVPIIR